MEIVKCILRCTIKSTPRYTPWLHCWVDYQLGVKCIIFFAILGMFICSLKWKLRCAQVEHRVHPQVHLFVESFCALLCPDKRTTMRIFKCNSFVTSSAPLISTSNAPFCASDYRSQGTTIGVTSGEPSVASSIALTNTPSSTPSSATSNASFFSLSYASSMVLVLSAYSSLTLTLPWSVPSSAASGPPLDELLCALMHQKVQYRRNSIATSNSPLTATSSATLKVQPQVHLLMCLYKCIIICSFNVPSGALSIALTSRRSTFYAVLNAS